MSNIRQKQKRKRTPHLVMRNACERYCELKNRILIDEICQLLPPNPDSWRRRKMSIQDVLWNAVRYIDILTETLQINDKTREAYM